MVIVMEAGVYLVVFLVGLVSIVMLLYARRRFLSGEFRDFIDAVVASAMAFLLGSFINLFFVIYYNTVFAPMLLVVVGFSFLLTSMFFIKAAHILHKVSKVFGFADLIEKDFGMAFEAPKSGKKSRKK